LLIIIVVLIDCGGGTIDLITYAIQATAPKLIFEEAVVGQGAKVGSTFIDRKFHQWLSSRLGHGFDNVDHKRIGPGSMFMRRFEAFKCNFGGARCVQQNYEISLRLPGVQDGPNYDEDERRVMFDRYV